MRTPSTIPAALLFGILAAGNASAQSPAAGPSGPEPDKAGARMWLNDRALDPGEGLVLVAPGDEVMLRLDVLPPAREPKPAGSAKADDEPARIRHSETATLDWSATSGSLLSLDTGQVMWLPAPDGGEPAVIAVEALLMTEVGELEGADRTQVVSQAEATVVLAPGMPYDREGSGLIGGAMIGVYPSEEGEDAPAPVRRNPALYRPPNAFYRLDDVTAGRSLRGGATLDFLNPPQFAGEGARLVAVSPQLPRFWEELRAAAARAGLGDDALKVLRGYISPTDRLRLERQGVRLARFTRYQYGDALAVIADADGDFRMDDLNGDGSVAIGDAEKLAEVVEDAFATADLAGGIGVCAAFEGPEHAGTPYVHVDLRGWRERWREE